VQAINAHGLRLQTASEDGFIPLAASTETSALQDADVVLFCVKSTATEATAELIRPHLAPGALVLTLQNGVDNADRVQAVLGEAHSVAAAVVYVATEMAGPGHVRHFGRGELAIAPSPASERVARGFTAAGIPTQVSDNVRGALWAKLVMNCAYNAVSAITQQPYGWLVQQPGAADVIDDLVAECLAVAQADGVVFPGDVRAGVQAIARTMPGQRSSTAQDLALGRPTEIEHLNGYIVTRGMALGVPTPVNRAMLVLVRMLQAAPAG
jgi:2-dehydropantoate 2-reductase